MIRRLAALALLLLLLSILVTAPLLAQRPEEISQDAAPGDIPAAFSLGPLHPSAAPFPYLKIHPQLLKSLLDNPEAQTRIIVEIAARPDLTAIASIEDAELRRSAVVDSLQSSAAAAQANALAILSEEAAKGNAAGVRSLWAFGGIAAQVDMAAVLRLVALPEVSLVRPELRYQLEPLSPAPAGSEEEGSLIVGQDIQWNISQVRANLAWSALQVDGSGIVVANVDSGVDWQHPALKSHYLGYDPHGLYQHACSWFDATGEGTTYPVDGNGHGTHTMGTAVGQGGIGVAPGANWIAVRAFDTQGYGWESWLHAAYQWILNPGVGCTPPDIVNNSWSSSAGDAATFRPDVQALRAAGIFAPFAAGNDGSSSASIDSPASYPETFSVGALTENDIVANFSSRGPSTWFGAYVIKPEVSGPGVNVRSSLPGGAYGLKSGTSMATPHVAGVAALMLQADNQLTVAQIETGLKDTAWPLGSPIPNNDSGYGRIDAYSAVAHMLNTGIISGAVTNTTTTAPISHATLTATPALTGASAHISTDASGHYMLGLAPDFYLLTASAYGFVSQSRPVMVYTDVTTIQDFGLQPLPTGALSGRVVGDGLPIGADNAPVITVVGTPVSIAADADGYYSTSLPAGSYTLTVASLGYRVAVTTAVPILSQSTTVRDFDLTPAPRILLVDGGGWYYESYISTYQQAMDELGYTYDTWIIDNPELGAPGSTDLAAYDVVFWSSPQDSPGYVNAGGALRTYLESGGSLFVSGQNVAYYDDYYPFIDTTYLTNYLKVAFVRDNSNIFTLTGGDSSIFAGLSLSISGAGGANNQTSPDEIKLTDTGAGRGIVSYVGDGSGGQQVGACLPYRGVVLSFGFEAITDPTVRTEVISRSLAFFVQAPAASGVEWQPDTSSRIGPIGGTVTHTLRLRATAETGPGDIFDLVASQNVWPTSLSTTTLRLAPCASAAVTISVHIPVTAAWSAADTAAVAAASQVYAGQAVTASLRTEGPAPVLLVDDDRFYNVEGYYTRALQSKGIPYQLWSRTPDISSPTTNTLAMYPIVLWVSAYDWHQPLTTEEEARLAHYLEAGGRLYYNGQDYLYATDGPDEFAQTYLGVSAYIEDFTSTHVSGVITSPVGAWLGPAQLALPYRNFSDVLTPTTTARQAMLNQAGRPNSVTNHGAAWRTTFFAFNPDGLPPATGEHLIQRLVGWLSWLGASQVTADRHMVRDGETLTYTVNLLNDGWQDIPSAYLTATFTSDLNPIPGSIQGGASWDASHQAFTWQGALSRNESRVFTYQTTVASPLPDGRILSHTVWMGYDSHNILFDRVDSTYVNYPQLSSSTFTVSPAAVDRGGWLTFSLQAHNTGFGGTLVTIDNPLPPYLAVSPSDLWASRGDVHLNGRQVAWSVPLSAAQSAVMTYTGWVTGIPTGFVLRNRATLYDGLGNWLELQSNPLVAPERKYLPVVLKN